MPNVLYPSAIEGLLDGTLRLSTDSLRVILTGAEYRFASEHRTLADIDPDDRVAISDRLDMRSFHDGVFDAADVTFGSPPLGRSAIAIVLYDEDTSDLIAYIDQGRGLPVITNGAPIVCAWSDAGIFSLT